MKIIATETFSNGIVSMFKGEIREITEGDPEYTALLSEGLVEEYSAGGGGGGTPTIVTATWDRNPTKPEDFTVTINKTSAELYAILSAGNTLLVDATEGTNPLYLSVVSFGSYEMDETTEYMFILPLPYSSGFELEILTGGAENNPSLTKTS